MRSKPGAEYLEIFIISLQPISKKPYISLVSMINFLTALKLAEKLEISVPEQIDIIAIEIVEDLTFSNDFSKELAGKYNDIYCEIKGFLEDSI